MFPLSINVLLFYSFITYVNITGKCFMTDQIYQGNYLRIRCANQSDSWKKGSPEECRDLCANTTGCDKFTWIEKDDDWKDGINRCCLKNMTGIEKEVIQPKLNRISGPIPCGKVSSYFSEY